MTTGFRTFNVLFLCARNSARSILAEALLNRLGAGRFQVSSAGFSPAGMVSLHAISLLHRINYNTENLASKPMTAVMGENDPGFDFIIRLSPDRRAGGLQSLRAPQFTGNPVVVDWHMPDAADMMGSTAAIAAAYADIFNHLAARIDAFANLSVDNLESTHIQARLERMGADEPRLAA